MEMKKKYLKPGMTVYDYPQPELLIESPGDEKPGDDSAPVGDGTGGNEGGL